MKNRKKKNVDTLIQARFGLMTKEEAAQLIQGGCLHLHSSSLLEKDPLYQNTLLGNQDYAWENIQKQTVYVKESTDRNQLIQKLIEELKLEDKRHLRERFATILEELLTNAIYHAYTDINGESKYKRSENVSLGKSEVVLVEYARTNEGLFLSVCDLGGTLKIKDVARSIARCYQKNENQIEMKEGGAGLGMYLIFELSTHLKILLEEGKHTKISCWIADKQHFDKNHFSFNYFTKNKKR